MATKDQRMHATYSSIVTHIADDAASGVRLQLALSLAVAFECELIGAGAESPELYLSPRGFAWPTPGYRLQGAETDIVARLMRLADEFAAFPGLEQVAHRWVAGLAEPSRFLSAHARGADLIVASRAPAGALTCKFPLPADLVLSAGRPVLFAPAGRSTPRFETIVIAWKDARECRRALVDALPFLQRAAKVVVAAVQEAADPQELEEAVDDVVVRLAMFGVAAIRQMIDPAGNSAVGALLDLADRQGCDLLVAGAYGHSRLRELVLGGFTETLLSEPRAVLLSH